MFNIHFLPIILLCFFTKTAFGGTCLGISASFFSPFSRVLNRKNSLKNNFYVKKNKIRYYIKDLLSLPKDMKYGTF